MKLAAGKTRAARPDGLGLGRINGAAGEAQVLGQAQAHQAGQTLGAAKSRHDSQVDLRLAEFGGLRGIDDVAGHGQSRSRLPGQSR